METLQQYLPLYLGQKIEYFDMFENKYSIGVLNGIHTNTGHFSVFVEGTSSGHDIDKCKLILRPISSMTEEEAKELIAPLNELRIMSIKRGGIQYSTPEMEFGSEFLFFSSLDPIRLKWLLSKGFDIFNLKEKGLAIYE